jgi:hypothetical protein
MHGRTASTAAGASVGTVTSTSSGTTAGAATTAAAAGVQEGFICPQCRRTLPSQQALMAHFSVLHAERRSSAEEERERSEELSAGGRSRRSSLGGASVSLEQFITALQRFMEDEPHAGYVLYCSNLVLNLAVMQHDFISVCEKHSTSNWVVLLRLLQA